MGNQDYKFVQSTVIILGVNCMIFPVALAITVAKPSSTSSATSLLLTEFMMDQALLIMGVRLALCAHLNIPVFLPKYCTTPFPLYHAYFRRQYAYPALPLSGLISQSRLSFPPCDTNHQVVFRAPTREALGQTQVERLWYHFMVLFSSASAFLTLDDARMLAAMRRRKEAKRTTIHQASTTDPESTQQTRQTKSSKQHRILEILGGAAGVISVLLGLGVIVWSVSEVSQCTAMWKLELGDGAPCSVPKFYFAQDAGATCGLGRVVDMNCANEITRNLPDDPASNTYSTMKSLRCISMNNNSALSKMPLNWRLAPALRNISVEHTSVHGLPIELCSNGSSKLANGMIKLKGSIAYAAVDWSDALPALHTLSTDVTPACRAATKFATSVNLSGNAINTESAWRDVEAAFPDLEHLDLSRNKMRGSWTILGASCAFQTFDRVEPWHAHKGKSFDGSNHSDPTRRAVWELSPPPSKGPVTVWPFKRTMDLNILDEPTSDTRCRVQLSGNELSGIVLCGLGTAGYSNVLHNWVRCLPDSLELLQIVAGTGVTHMLHEKVHQDLMGSWLPRLRTMIYSNVYVLGLFPTIPRDRAFGMGGLKHLLIRQKDGQMRLGPDIGLLTNLEYFIPDDLVLDATTKSQVWGNLSMLTKMTHLELVLKPSQESEVHLIPPSFGKLTDLAVFHFVWPPGAVLELPPSFGRLTNLEQLTLNTDSQQGGQLKLTGSDDALFKMTKLLRLEIIVAALVPSTLPTAIDRLSNLYDLRLKINATVLPDSIGNMRALRTLSLGWNRLRTLPDSFGRLTELIRITARNNLFASCPPALKRMRSLLSLELKNNRRFAYIGEDTFPPTLEHLDLGDLRITSISPAAFSSVPNLMLLMLKNNMLRSLPTTLGLLTKLLHLDVSYNALTELPTEIGLLINLTPDVLISVS